jgi:YfiR/HmsC-like
VEILTVITAVILALLSLLTGPEQTSRAREDEIKVAYLFNFAKFVDWPAQQDGGAQFSFVVLGVDPYGDVLDAVLAGKQVKGRPVVLRRTATLAGANSPQILFISRSEAPSCASLLGSVDGRPILTVADIEGFAERGGMIEFVNDGNRVRFVINGAAVRRAGLRMDAALLNVAARVIGQPR